MQAFTDEEYANYIDSIRENRAGEEVENVITENERQFVQIANLKANGLLTSQSCVACQINKFEIDQLTN